MEYDWTTRTSAIDLTSQVALFPAYKGICVIHMRRTSNVCWCSTMNHTARHPRKRATSRPCGIGVSEGCFYQRTFRFVSTSSAHHSHCTLEIYSTKWYVGFLFEYFSTLIHSVSSPDRPYFSAEHIIFLRTAVAPFYSILFHLICLYHFLPLFLFSAFRGHSRQVFSAACQMRFQRNDLLDAMRWREYRN